MIYPTVLSYRQEVLMYRTARNSYRGSRGMGQSVKTYLLKFVQFCLVKLQRPGCEFEFCSPNFLKNFLPCD